MRTSAEDGSQRMLNAMEPGTVLPIHRHRGSTETVVVLVETLVAAPGTECVGFSVEVGRWHLRE